jgi:transcriptional regulator with XRE-family HTH domain
MQSNAERQFGLLLRRHRLALGLTQEELAERAHMSAQGISNLERGIRRLPYKITLQQLVDALALNPADREQFLAAGHAEPKGSAEGSPLQAARTAFLRHDWAGACALLAAAEAEDSLGPEDLEMLGEALWAAGRYADSLPARERAYARYVAGEEPAAAAKIAVIIATDYILRLEMAVAGGWQAAAGRLLAGQPEHRAHGLSAWLDGQVAMMIHGDLDRALRRSLETVAIVDRLADLDIQTLGRTMQGRALIKSGRISEGMELIDEAAVAAVGGQLSAWVAGHVYCNTLGVCQEVADFRRAGEWIAAARQSSAGIIPASGHCRVHEAGILRRHGEWQEAEEQARSGCDQLHLGDQHHVGLAMYEIGEIRLRKGDLAGAEAAFGRANELGRTPQPGLALLRMAQGKLDSAISSIGSALADDSWDRFGRVSLLAAQVEIALAAGHREAAHTASQAIAEIASDTGIPAMTAVRASVEGLLALAVGDAAAALSELRRSYRLWQEIGASYEVAKARMAMAEAYAGLGDTDSAAFELSASVATFERLGAAPDIQRASELLTAIGGEAL